MRILHTIPGRNWGGMEHRTLEQVRWLSAHGHWVRLAAPADGEPYRRAMAMNLPVIAMDFDRPWRRSTVKALRAVVRDQGIEVIDAHVTRDAKASLCCLDLCAVVRSRHVNQPLKPSAIRRLQWRLSDHIITVAECTRAHLIDIGLADPARSESIGGWADERFFDLPDPVATRAQLRGAIGLAETEFVLLCVGMLRPDKGQDHLIRALALMKRQGLAPTCVLAGSATAESAEYEAMLMQLAAEQQVDVRLLGYREDVSELMQMADAVVIPSLTEAQPRVAVQAFATGKPVIASAVGGVPEIVKDGETGWLVPSADADALAAALIRVMQYPDEAARIAEGAGEMAKQRMRFDHRMAQTLTAYATAIEHARQRWLPPLSGKPQ
jgi:glycosyltransferase involved in cell wall biosynthesis